MPDETTAILSRFRETAEKFIETVDTAPRLERDAFLEATGRCLSGLYSSALQIPYGKLESSEPPSENGSVPKDEWLPLYRLLREKLGEVDRYWLVFDPTENEAPVQGSLAIDISEIYQDLQESLHLMDDGKIPEADLLWQLRFDFRSHWGRHLLGALTAIHHRFV
jgi:hypothetical protein